VDEQPVTRYAKAPDGVSIAYQVTGDGPFNVVFPPGLPLPIDVLWEDPSFVRFARSLGGFSRTVWRELRGVGASGGDVEDLRDDDILCGDLTAVLDAVGCERVVLVGFGFGGPTAIRYAVLRPERVSALVLSATRLPATSKTITTPGVCPLGPSSNSTPCRGSCGARARRWRC
jgi:pimeloyl-ACP methyl ester carboxylesterase